MIARYDYCGASLIADYTLTDVNLNSVVSTASTLNCNVFVLFLDVNSAATLIEKAYESGLFHEGTTLYLSSYAASTSILKYFSDDVDITRVLRGSQGWDLWSNYGMSKTTVGKSFVSSYLHELSTVPDCSELVDSSGFRYMYRNSTSTSCSNFDFTTLTNDTIDSYVAYVYDAVWTLIYGVKAADMPSSTDEVMTAMVNNISFVGASGLVKFASGDASNKYYGRGTPVEGVYYYKLYNFNTEQYNLNKNNSYVPIRVGSVGVTSRLCTTVDFSDCKKPERNTRNGLLSNGYPPYSLATTPSVLKIGGIFSPFSSIGTIDVSQAENIAALLLAVKQINDKSDGIADHLLPDSQIVFALEYAYDYVTGTNAALNLLDSFYGSGVLGIIDGIDGEPAIAVDNILASTNTFVHVTAASVDSILAYASENPYTIKLNPLNNYQGLVYQDILCNHFKYRNIAVLTTTDYDGVSTIAELLDGTICNLRALTYFTFDLTTTDFSSYLSASAKSGAAVYLIMVDSLDMTSLILEQGYNLGVFTTGLCIFQ